MNSTRAQTVAVSTQGFNEGRNIQDGLTQLCPVTVGQKQKRQQLHKNTCTIPQMHSMHYCIKCAALQQERCNFWPPLFGSVGTMLRDHELQILALEIFFSLVNFKNACRDRRIKSTFTCGSWDNKERQEGWCDREKQDFQNWLLLAKHSQPEHAFCTRVQKTYNATLVQFCKVDWTPNNLPRPEAS